MNYPGIRSTARPPARLISQSPALVLVFRVDDLTSQEGGAGRGVVAQVHRSMLRGGIADLVAMEHVTDLVADQACALPPPIYPRMMLVLPLPPLPLPLFSPPTSYMGIWGG